MRNVAKRQLVLLLFAAFALGADGPAPVGDPDEHECREHLSVLGNAVALYLRGNEGKLPARLSDLYVQGLVPDLAVFNCPGSGNKITAPDQIDGMTDYAIAPRLTAERPMRLLWEKQAHHQGKAVQFMSNRTFATFDPATRPIVSTTATTGPATRPASTTRIAATLPSATRPAASPFAGHAAPVDPAAWQVREKARFPQGYSSVDNGHIRLHAGGRGGGATDALLRAPVQGDFDLRLEYAVDRPDPKLLMWGFGIRATSPAEFKGPRGVTLDRRTDHEGSQYSAASAEGPDDKAAGVRTDATTGFLRMTRAGNQFQSFYWDDTGQSWTRISALDLAAAPGLELFVVAYKVGPGEVNVTVPRLELLQPR
jgi:hypothetical protein